MLGGLGEPPRVRRLSPSASNTICCPVAGVRTRFQNEDGSDIVPGSERPSEARLDHVWEAVQTYDGAQYRMWVPSAGCMQQSDGQPLFV
jgi:hypothetical protein